MKTTCPTCGRSHVIPEVRDHAAVFEWMRQNPCRTSQDISDGVRQGLRHVLPQLDDLRARGLVSSSGRGVKGDPRLWFVVTEPREEHH